MGKAGRSTKPRPERYAMLLDLIGPGRLDDCWIWRGLRF